MQQRIEPIQSDDLRHASGRRARMQRLLSRIVVYALLTAGAIIYFMP
jgi:hypothetical protein